MIQFNVHNQIYEAVRKEMRWNPVDAIEMFQNWIAGEITEPHRKKISVVVAAWLLSRRYVSLPFVSNIIMYVFKIIIQEGFKGFRANLLR